MHATVKLLKTQTTNFGIETAPLIGGHKFWQLIPNDIKTASSLLLLNTN